MEGLVDNSIMEMFGTLSISEKGQFMRQMTRNRELKTLSKSDLKEIIAITGEEELKEIIFEIKKA